MKIKGFKAPLKSSVVVCSYVTGLEVTVHRIFVETTPHTIVRPVWTEVLLPSQGFRPSGIFFSAIISEIATRYEK